MKSYIDYMVTLTIKRIKISKLLLITATVLHGGCRGGKRVVQEYSQNHGEKHFFGLKRKKGITAMAFLECSR